MMWQLMFSAPKDGRHVDLWQNGVRVAGCAWFTQQQLQEKLGVVLPGCWVGPGGVLVSAPSHWMPVPAPPAAATS